MIQDSAILRWFKKQEKIHSDSWFVLLVTKPSLYLYTLVKKTCVMGVYLFLFVEFFDYFGLKQQPIPSTLHSVLGVVIGLLLVFRTNTAYDRWWEARKIFATLHASLLYFRIKSKHVEKEEEIIQAILGINNAIFDYVSTNDYKESSDIKCRFMKHYNELSELFFCAQLPTPIYGTIERKMVELLEHFSSFERIKFTPIPISYSMHIKISVFVYLLTLPIGLFFGLGMWAIPLVMILFFIISGIEIISNEIENPFKGDPNDLPIEDFRKETEIYITKQHD